MKQDFHNSTPRNLQLPLEREADHFSSVLLIPDFYLDTFKCQSITIDHISKISQDCQTSLTAAAIRYAKSDREEMVVVLSKGFKIENIWHSTDLPFGLWVDYKMKLLPEYSVTKSAVRGGLSQSEGEIGQGSWFPDATSKIDVFEETKKLGDTGLYLTILTF